MSACCPTHPARWTRTCRPLSGPLLKTLKPSNPKTLPGGAAALPHSHPTGSECFTLRQNHQTGVRPHMNASAPRRRAGPAGPVREQFKQVPNRLMHGRVHTFDQHLLSCVTQHAGIEYRCGLGDRAPLSAQMHEAEQLLTPAASASVLLDVLGLEAIGPLAVLILCCTLDSPPGALFGVSSP